MGAWRLISPVLSWAVLSWIAVAAPAHAGALAAVYEFQGHADGGGPLFGLTAQNRLLYGTTSRVNASANGTPATLFSFDPITRTKTLLHGFDPGTGPAGPLVFLSGSLYGTVGPGDGTATGIYAYDLTTGAWTMVYTAGGPQNLPAPGALQRYGTLLYTSGFRFNPTTGRVTLLPAWSRNISVVNNVIYSLSFDPTSNAATISRVNPNTGMVSPLPCSFPAFATTDPATWTPGVPTAISDGVLYGMGQSLNWEEGYPSYVYACATQPGAVLAEPVAGSGQFAGNDVLLSGRVLYGTTFPRESTFLYVAGTFFTYDPCSATITGYPFVSPDGQSVGVDIRGPLAAVDGIVYGAALLGGVADADGPLGYGTIFSYTP